jgi:hypothetical protein
MRASQCSLDPLSHVHLVWSFKLQGSRKKPRKVSSQSEEPCLDPYSVFRCFIPTM